MQQAKQVLWFGKHQGKSLEEVPEAYLRWLASGMRNEYLRTLAQQVLAEREQQPCVAPKNDESSIGLSSALAKHLKLMKESLSSEKARNADAAALAKHMSLVTKGASIAPVSTQEQDDDFEREQQPCVAPKNDESSIGLSSALAKHLKLMKESLSSEKARNADAAALAKHMSLVTKGASIAPVSTQNDFENVESIVLQLRTTSQLHEAKVLQALVLASKHFASNAAYLCNLMLLMFGRCKSVKDATAVFDGMAFKQVFTWNAMLKVYMENECWEEADSTFQKMNNANVISCTCMVSLYASQGRVEDARAAFDRIPREKLDVAAWNALIGCYAKNSCSVQAKETFDRMQNRDVVSWNALLAAYTQSGDGVKAEATFSLMPKWDTFSWNIAAPLTVEDAASPEDAKAMFDKLPVRNIMSWTLALSAFCKHGRMEEAEQISQKLPAWDAAVWNTILKGYSRDGQVNRAMELFHWMNLEGMEPSDVSFVCLLDGFSHVAKVKDGRACFASMVGDYGIQAQEMHYVCMVDMLGRAGKLKEAEELVETMPYVPSIASWNALLGACRNHKDMDRATRASASALKSRPDSASTYVLLANTCSSRDADGAAETVKKAMQEQGVKRIPGVSKVTVDGQVHRFVVGDKTHPMSKQINAELDRLTELMKDAGYVPNTSVVTLVDDLSGDDDDGEKRKQELLCRHSEKLALAFALISTKDGEEIQVSKNLRMCYDCHDATRFLSKLVGRNIVVRDANRIHRFKNGVCSCGDFW